MTLGTFCLCFTARSNETGDGLVMAHTKRSADGNGLPTRLGSSSGQQATVHPTAVDASSSSLTFCSEKALRKLGGPSSASGGNPSTADPPSQPTLTFFNHVLGCENPTPQLSVELTNLAEGGRIPGITFPASASVPVSFDKHDPSERTLKARCRNVSPSDAAVNVRSLSQFVVAEPCGDLCASGSHPSTTSPESNAEEPSPTRRLLRPLQLPLPLPLPLSRRTIAAQIESGTAGAVASGGGASGRVFIPAKSLSSLLRGRGLPVLGPRGKRAVVVKVAAAAAPKVQHRANGLNGASSVSSLVRVMELTRKLSQKGSTLLTQADSGGMKKEGLLVPMAAASTAPPLKMQGPAAAATAVSIFTTNAALGVVNDGGSRSSTVDVSFHGVAGIEAGAATAAVAGPRVDVAVGPMSVQRDAAPPVPAHSSAPMAPVYSSRAKLPYMASRHMSQVAFLQMLQVGGETEYGSSSGGGGAGEETPPEPLAPTFLQQQQLWTLNLAALSREITGLRWIGQGGGGAVFQGVWQGATVAVKFLLESEGELGNGHGSGGMDVMALEGVVSSVVNHPNVVHTFAFQCARLTDASFAADPDEDGRLDGLLDDQGNRDLFESLLDTAGLYGAINSAYGNAYGSGGGVRRRASQNMAMIATTVAGGGGGLAAAAAPAAGASRFGNGGGIGAAGHPLTRFGSSTQEPDEGGGGDASAVSEVDCKVEAKVAGRKMEGTEEEEEEEEEEEGQSIVVASPVRIGMDVAACEAAERGGDGGGGGSGGGSLGSAGGGTGDGRRRVLGAAVVNGRLRTKAAAKNSLQVQQQQRQAALESTFHSDEGFGDPEFGTSRGWNVRQALQHLKARPGMCMTYIIMEFCDRGSLLAAIRRGIFQMEDDPSTNRSHRDAGDLPASPVGGVYGHAAAPQAVGNRFPRRIVLRAIIRTARDIAQGMCHLHANGIIHGDLKPGNVLLRGCRSDRRGFVAMVADFGLSKVTRSEKPLEAHHWSTVTVMAPEVIMGRWLKASDVFSFGILLWQLVTSEPVPYGKLTIPQILMGVSQGSLKPDWPASAHPAIVRLGRACLATSPEKRPSFEAIVKVLIKIEKLVRDELRVQRFSQGAAAAEPTRTATAVTTTASQRYGPPPAAAALPPPQQQQQQLSLATKAFSAASAAAPGPRLCNP